MSEFTIKTLGEAKQACFTGAVRGLRHQHWKMCIDKEGKCAWNRGRGGVHCAIGWLIPWPNQHSYQSDAQTAGNAIADRLLAPVLHEWLDKAPEGEAKAFRSFLNAMQIQHDCGDDMCARFRQLGVDNNLKWPEEDTQEQA